MRGASSFQGASLEVVHSVFLNAKFYGYLRKKKRSWFTRGCLTRRMRIHRKGLRKPRWTNVWRDLVALILWRPDGVSDTAVVKLEVNHILRVSRPEDEKQAASNQLQRVDTSMSDIRSSCTTSRCAGLSHCGVWIESHSASFKT